MKHSKKKTSKLRTYEEWTKAFEIRSDGTRCIKNRSWLPLFDISENKVSRNFDLMIDKWRLLKITLQAPFLNVQKDV
ncbi:hypothetical protein Tco_1469778 [Tanacetum coccineum]